MNSKELSDIVKVTAAILIKDNKIIIAKRGYGTKGSRIQGAKGSPMAGSSFHYDK